jgi:hypothetical protein
MDGGPAPLPSAQAVPSWTSGAKDLVMTALGSSRVWATIGQGIFTEIYWPAVDQPQVKDLGFLIGGTGWWQEVKRAGTYTLSTPEPGLMLPTIVHAGRNQAYQLTLRPVVDPDHDALLIGYDLAGAGVKEFPGIPPTVDPQLEHAREKYADLVRDHPEYAGLPYVVIYLASSFVSLDLVDRKMPTRRELSGLVFAVRGRRWKEACAAISMEEFERRFDEKDFAGFPDPNETEWRLVANPYAHRPVPTAFSNVCLPGWPKDVPFPDSITPADDARAKAALASLDGDEKMALEAIWYSYGRLDAKRKEWRPIDAAVDKLIARRLARAVADHVFELTTEGLLCALVKDAPL